LEQRVAESFQPGGIEVTGLQGQRWLVALKGEHDFSSADELGSRLEAIHATGTALVVDLSDTPFMDSSILRVLLEADRRAQPNPAEHFALVAIHDSPPERLLRLTGVHRVIQTFGSVEEAFAHFDETDRSTTNMAERRITRKQRIVKNEQEFRDYNNRRLQAEPVAATNDKDLIPFLCECGDRDCIEALMLTAAEFTEAHAAANLFIVKPGHIFPDIERILRDAGHFIIVQKITMQPRSAS
jgi:anti-anti-sigma factor